jgi:hypothetical protein
MSSHDSTEVYAARDEIDATLVQSMLAEAGIEARVVGGEIAGAIGAVPAGLPSAPRVWVTDEDAAAATSLIREMEEKRAETWRQHTKIDDEQTKTSEPSLGEQVTTAAVLATGVVIGAAAFGTFPRMRAGNKTDEDSADHDEVWECSGCHEPVTVDFEICWNCQQPRISDGSLVRQVTIEWPRGVCM